MRQFLPMTVFVICACFAGSVSVAQEGVPRPFPATVEGRIVNKEQAEVTVRLEVVRPTPLGYSDGYIGTVAPDGHFLFENVLRKCFIGRADCR
jgi:hypothetical protein